MAAFIQKVTPIVLRNPRFGICLSLEAKNCLADAIAAHDRHMKASLINLRDNRVSGHAGRGSPGKRNALGELSQVKASRSIDAIAYNFNLSPHRREYKWHEGSLSQGYDRRGDRPIPHQIYIAISRVQCAL